MQARPEQPSDAWNPPPGRYVHRPPAGVPSPEAEKREDAWMRRFKRWAEGAEQGRDGRTARHRAGIDTAKEP